MWKKQEKQLQPLHKLRIMSQHSLNLKATDTKPLILATTTNTLSLPVCTNNSNFLFASAAWYHKHEESVCSGATHALDHVKLCHIKCTISLKVQYVPVELISKPLSVLGHLGVDSRRTRRDNASPAADTTVWSNKVTSASTKGRGYHMDNKNGNNMSSNINSKTTAAMTECEQCQKCQWRKLILQHYCHVYPHSCSHSHQVSDSGVIYVLSQLCWSCVPCWVNLCERRSMTLLLSLACEVCHSLLFAQEVSLARPSILTKHLHFHCYRR